MDPTRIRLREWVERNQAETNRLLSLRSRITADAVRHRWVADDPIVIPFWRQLSYAGLGAAVTAVVFLAGLHGLASRSAAQGDGSLRLASIPIRQMENSRALFAEMKRLFPGELRWVAQSDGQVALGVGSSLAGHAESAPVAVRVLVLSREVGGTVWRQAWKADLVVRGQDRVEVIPDRRVENKLTLWIYPLDDGKLAVDTRMDLRLPVTVAARVDAVVDSGRPSEIASMTINGIEYRILQTVEVMNGRI